MNGDIIQKKIMDNFERIFRRGFSFNQKTLFELAPISEEQKVHLTKVYSTLALSSLITFITIVTKGPWEHLPPLIGLIMLLGSLFYLLYAKFTETGNQKRLVALGLISVGLGVMYRKFLRYLFRISPDTVTTALMGTIGIFASFTLAALYMKKRMEMYLLGVVFSISSYIIMAKTVNLFIRSGFVNNVLMALGLVVFSMYVVIDTQFILRSVEQGDKDYIMHTMMLYSDIFSLFLETLTLIAERKGVNSEKKKKSK